MTREEHLLTIATEECAEVAQRISKAIRFGRQQYEPGQLLDNDERIRLEFADLVAVLRMIDARLTNFSQHELDVKMRKVESYMRVVEGSVVGVDPHQVSSERTRTP